MSNIMERLAIDTLATFEAYVIPFSQGGLAGGTLRNIVVDIEGNTEKGLDVIGEMAFVSDLFYGYFEVKLGENQVQAQTANSLNVQGLLVRR